MFPNQCSCRGPYFYLLNYWMLAARAGPATAQPPSRPADHSPLVYAFFPLIYASTVLCSTVGVRAVSSSFHFGRLCCFMFRSTCSSPWYAFFPWVCVLPLGLCVLPLGICVLPLGICIFPLGICVLPLGICVLPLGICVLPYQIG